MGSMADAFDITRVTCGGDFGAWRCPKGTAAIKRLRFHEFIWMSEGAGNCRVGGSTFTLKAGDILLLKPGTTVRWDFNADAMSIVRSFTFQLTSVPVSWPPAAQWPVTRHMPDGDVLRPLFEYVVTNAGKRDVPPSTLAAAVEAMMATFISGPLDCARSIVPTYPAPLLLVMQWISKFMFLTPAKKVTLLDLASASGVCPTHLCRLFQDHIGVGPLEFVYVIRVTRSLIRLTAGKSVESVAYEFGFSDVSHYTRRFKTVFGRSPGDMQKAMARGFRPPLPKLPLMGEP